MNTTSGGSLRVSTWRMGRDQFCVWWTSLLPGLVGVALPLWLERPGFAFQWLKATEFATVIILLQLGFGALFHRFDTKRATNRRDRRLLIAGGSSLVAGCLIGLHIHGSLTLHEGVFQWIFPVYCAAILFLGVLYTVPPLRFRDRIGGEIVLAYGLGMMPVLGGFLVEVGDITRVVYLASMPMVAAMWLWVWTGELVSATEDRTLGRQTLVLAFGERFSSRWILPVLLAGYVLSVLGAVGSRSLPVTAAVLLSVVIPGWKIILAGRARRDRLVKMIRARRGAGWIYLFTCCVSISVSIIEYFK